MKETLQGKPKGGKAQTGGTGEHSAKTNKRHRDRIRWGRQVKIPENHVLRSFWRRGLSWEVPRKLGVAMSTS